MKKRKGIVVVIILMLAILIGASYIILVVMPHKGLSEALESKILSDVIPGENLPADIRYTNAVYQAITFNVESDDKSSGTAEVTFTYPDVAQLAEQYPEASNIEENDNVFYEYCIECITSGSATTNTETITVTYSKGDDGYEIDHTPELANVLTGGAYNIFVESVGGEN